MHGARRFGRALLASALVAIAGGLLAVATSGEPPAPAAPSSTADPPAVMSRGAVRLGASGPTLGGCPMFPADNPWNQRVDGLPLRADSAAIIARIQGFGRQNLHPDFGSNPDYGIPFVVVPADQPLVPVTYVAYGDESDPGPFPVPLDAPVEAGNDRHVLVLRRGTCELFELYRAFRAGAGWQADSGARFDLRSNALRPLGWTSADAAGLPILPGLVRYDEVVAGRIDHALRVTFPRTQRGYILPATHFASSDTDPTLPPMGLRLRLRADYDLSGVTGHALVVARALQRYGLIVADNGSSWFISGATDHRWDDTDLGQLKRIPGSAFEVVDTGPVLR